MDWQLKDRYTIRFLSCLHSEKYSVLLNISNNITVDQWSKFRFKYCLTLTGAQKYLTFSHPLQTSGKSTDMAKKKRRENLSCEITKSALILAQKDVFVLDTLLTEKIGFQSQQILCGNVLVHLNKFDYFDQTSTLSVALSSKPTGSYRRLFKTAHNF